MKSLLLLLVLAAPPTIEVPDKIEPGHPVILQTVVDDNAAYLWQSLDKGAKPLTVFETCIPGEPKRQVCILPETKPGAYRVQLIRAVVDEATISPVIEIADVTVTIGDAPDEPDDPEPPNPGDVSMTVTELAKIVGDKETAGTLALQFVLVSGQDHKTVADLVAATDTLVAAATKGKEQKWKPFLDGLAVVLEKLAESGELRTVDDHRRVWRQIADGLVSATKGANAWPIEVN